MILKFSPDFEGTSRVSVQVRASKKLLVFRFSKKYVTENVFESKWVSKTELFRFTESSSTLAKTKLFVSLVPTELKKEVFLVEKPYHDTSNSITISQISTFLKPKLRFPKKSNLLSDFTHTSRLKILNKIDLTTNAPKSYRETKLKF